MTCKLDNSELLSTARSHAIHLIETLVEQTFLNQFSRTERMGLYEDLLNVCTSAMDLDTENPSFRWYRAYVAYLRDGGLDETAQKDHAEAVRLGSETVKVLESSYRATLSAVEKIDG